MRRTGQDQGIRVPLWALMPRSKEGTEMDPADRHRQDPFHKLPMGWGDRPRGRGQCVPGGTGEGSRRIGIGEIVHH